MFTLAIDRPGTAITVPTPRAKVIVTRWTYYGRIGLVSRRSLDRVDRLISISSHVAWALDQVISIYVYARSFPKVRFLYLRMPVQLCSFDVMIFLFAVF